MSEKQRKTLAAFAVILFLIFFLAVAWFVGQPLLQFISEPEKFRDWVDSHGIWGRLIFVGMFVFQIFIAIVPGEPIEIGAGYAFSTLEGTVLSVISILIGSTLVFLFVRKFGRKALEIFFPNKDIDSLRFLQNTQKLKTVMFIVFLLPGTPKDLLSYYAGLTKISLSEWLFIAGVARLPSVITSTIGGHALGSGDYKTAAIVFAATAIISITGFLVYQKFYLSKRVDHKAKKEVS